MELFNLGSKMLLIFGVFFFIQPHPAGRADLLKVNNFRREALKKISLFYQAVVKV